MTKRILTWLCVLALGALLVACTPNGGSAGEGSGAGDTAEATVTAADPAETNPQTEKPSGGDIELPRVEF